MPILSAPSVVIEIPIAVMLRKFLIENAGNIKHSEEFLTVAMVRRHTFQMSEFADKVWTQMIQPMCPEPWCYYINQYRYIKDELMKAQDCLGLFISEEEIKEMNKYDWRKLWCDMEYSPDDAEMFCVDMVGLWESINEASHEALCDHKCSVCNWRDCEEDCVSDSEIPHEVFAHYEMEAEMLRGK